MRFPVNRHRVWQLLDRDHVRIAERRDDSSSHLILPWVPI